MRDRYSIVVGLLFLAVIVVAAVNTIGGGEGGRTLGLDGCRPAGRCPSSPFPTGAGELEGDANVAQDDCETSAIPCPEEAQRTPACRVDLPESIRVCDFFDRPLVISFWFSKGDGDCVEQQDLVERVYRRYRGRVGFLSLDIRDDRDTVRDLIRAARLEDAGGLRPRRRRRQPLRRRRLPDLRLRLSRRDPGERQHRRAHRRPAERPGRAAAGGDRRARNGAEVQAGAASRDAWAGCRRRSRAGSPPTSPPSSPASGSPGSSSRPKPGRSPERGAAAPARPLRPHLRRPGDPACANGRSPGPTASSSARSGSTPTAPAPPSSSSPSIGSTTAASEPRPARRRAQRRDRRDRGRAARLRRRPGRGQPLHPRLGAGRVAGGRAASWRRGR